MDSVTLTLFYATVAAVVITAIYWFKSPFRYWKKRGVPQWEPQYPLVGDFFLAISKPPHEHTTQIYNSFSNERFVGFYINTRPTIMIRDPDLVKHVLIKDFSQIADRGSQSDPSQTLSKHLLNLEEDHWKNMRNKLTPTFSSGKLKGMHSQLIDCGNSLLTYMKHLEDGRPFEVRDVISRFTMDVIASCAFGLNIDTINDPESEFRKMGLSAFKPTTPARIAFALRTAPKWVSKAVRIFVPGSVLRTSSKFANFFIAAVDKTVEHRQKNNITRPDFLHLMNELKAKDEELVKNKELDPNHPFIFDHSSLVSNAFVFFLAGFETTATTVSYTIYELAINPEIQQLAYNEVVATLKKHGGQPTYEAVNEMTYLENCISETLRKYPPATALSRKITQEYRLPGTDILLPKGTHVTIPTYAFHHDPQYFAEPDKYIPQRFDKDKDAIRKNTYLPFGGGPRICIGARFAKVEAKLCLAMILNNYKFAKCEQTKVPLKFDKNAFLLVPEGGIWVALEKRAQRS